MLTSQGNAAGAAQIAQGNIWGNTTNQIGAILGRKYGGGTTGQPGVYTGNTGLEGMTPDALANFYGG
jgi:hypothetical protein